MDETKALFQKIKRRDRNAFGLLTDTYGWKLYSYIRRKTDNRETADRIFSETFSRFYDSMDHYESEDPIEAMLYVYADLAGQGFWGQRGEDLSRWQIARESDFTLPQAPKRKKRRRFWSNFFYTLCILLLLAGIAAALWYLVWMLMDMNLIPQYDLGYTWFNIHFFDLFH